MSSSGAPVSLTLSTARPEPSAEEVAAIMAAASVLWSGLVGPIDDEPRRRPSAWKFSGRWWSQPLPLRRARPWT
ncbi:hypothetical protein BH24ACT5_BH24ACT5_24350 [soil metagenome]